MIIKAGKWKIQIGGKKVKVDNGKIYVDDTLLDAPPIDTNTPEEDPTPKCWICGDNTGTCSHIPTTARPAPPSADSVPGYEEARKLQLLIQQERERSAKAVKDWGEAINNGLVGGGVYFNGKKIAGNDKNCVRYNLIIQSENDLQEVKADGDVEVNGNVDNVKAGGDVEVNGDAGGTIQAGGDVEVNGKHTSGTIQAGGDVSVGK